jgi:hypothetical protein
MQKIIIPVFLTLVVCVFESSRPLPGQDDAEKMKAALTGFFHGIETQDFDELNRVTTSDFVLYEDGRIWNMDSAVMNIKSHMPFKVKYQLNNIKINVDSHSGDVTYINHADFEFSAGKLSLDWIESATFRKIDGVWKINFLQATVRK